MYYAQFQIIFKSVLLVTFCVTVFGLNVHSDEETFYSKSFCI